jgi:3',5'-nucleoside bisphosphate phosphatase
MFKADLHCHSTFSDGTFSPQELIDCAKNIGLGGLSITDHDTVNAYSTALPYAKEKQLPLISGIEFSATESGVSVHMLGYGFALDSPDIEGLCLKHKTRRGERNRAILDKLAKLNMPVDLHDVEGYSIGRPHIAQALMQKGYVASVDEAFKKYLGENKACYVPGTPISVEETLEAIHAAKGVAIIAHPHLIMQNKIIKKLLAMPFEGIEVYYARFAKEECGKWLQIARDKQWLITGGSDFHGSVKPDIQLGCSTIDEEIFQKLYELHQRNNS